MNIAPCFSISQAMRLKILIPLLAAASCGTGLAATGISGSHVDIFTTTGTAHHGEGFASQSGFYCQNLGTLNLPNNPDEEGNNSGSKSRFILIPEPASAFLGIIGVVLILLRRK